MDGKGYIPGLAGIFLRFLSEGRWPALLHPLRGFQPGVGSPARRGGDGTLGSRNTKITNYGYENDNENDSESTGGSEVLHPSGVLEKQDRWSIRKIFIDIKCEAIARDLLYLPKKY